MWRERRGMEDAPLAHSITVHLIIIFHNHVMCKTLSIVILTLYNCCLQTQRISWEPQNPVEYKCIIRLTLFLKYITTSAATSWVRLKEWVWRVYDYVAITSPWKKVARIGVGGVACPEKRDCVLAAKSKQKDTSSTTVLAPSHYVISSDLLPWKIYLLKKLMMELSAISVIWLSRSTLNYPSLSLIW